MGAACRLLRVAGGDVLHDLEREGLIALLDAVSKLGDPFGFLPPEAAGPQGQGRRAALKGPVLRDVLERAIEVVLELGDRLLIPRRHGRLQMGQEVDHLLRELGHPLNLLLVVAPHSLRLLHECLRQVGNFFQHRVVVVVLAPVY